MFNWLKKLLTRKRKLFTSDCRMCGGTLCEQPFQGPAICFSCGEPDA